MKKYLSLYLIALISAVSVLSSCKKDSDDDITPQPSNPTAGLTLLSEGYAVGAAVKVEIWSKKSYSTGYNKLYVFLKDSLSGQPVKTASISLIPMMDMGTMTHASPLENPVSTQSSDGLYPCAVYFTMSSMSGTWTLGVNVTLPSGGATGMAMFSITVNDLAQSRMKSFISAAGGETLFVSLIEPDEPKVGLNDLEIAIHKKGPMGMTFPADSSLSVEINPQMLSMGHGSPNNVDPVHSGLGHYKGVVNFTMSGDWRVYFDFLDGTSVAYDSLYFDMDIP